MTCGYVNTTTITLTSLSLNTANVNYRELDSELNLIGSFDNGGASPYEPPRG